MGTLDSRLAANFLIGLSEYYRILHVGAGHGTYTPTAVAVDGYSGTPSSSAVYAKMDQAINRITATQFRTTDWRDGIFIDNATAGDWQAWGQVQILALAKSYRLKRDMGQPAAALDGMLDIVCYSADRFYGLQAYHYADTVNGFARTRERITSITGWAAKFHTNDTQSVYQDSSIVVGLVELGEAYGQSGRTDAATRKAQYLQSAKIVGTWFIGNNSVLLPMYAGASGPAAYDGCGAVFDEIRADTPTPYRKTDAGGESTAEGLWALAVIKDAIQRHSLGTTFTFTV
jgi:hypothetical protein